MEHSGGWLGFATIALIFLHGLFSAFQNERTRKRLEDRDEEARLERERIVTETLEFQKKIAADLAVMTSEQVSQVVQTIDKAHERTGERLTAVQEQVQEVYKAVETSTQASVDALAQANNFTGRLDELKQQVIGGGE